NDESYGFVKNPEIKDRDNNGKPEFMIKFYRHPIKNLLETGEQTETLITGKTSNNKLFIGKDTIKIKEKK
ncbi:hypothetical protein KKG83_04425, partial [Candidatus Micrarchaeota archaeon]|nr:hypothetical protein [Candidatus Micrarchaeota archaeon]